MFFDLLPNGFQVTSLLLIEGNSCYVKQTESGSNSPNAHLMGDKKLLQRLHLSSASSKLKQLKREKIIRYFYSRYLSKPVSGTNGMVTSQSVIDFKHHTENMAITDNVNAGSDSNHNKDLVTRRNRIKNWAKNAVRKCNSTIVTYGDSFRWLQDITTSIDSQTKNVSLQVSESVFNKLCSENIDLTTEPYSDAVSTTPYQPLETVFSSF